MARRAHHYRRSKGETSELDMTTFMNLMVVLVPFLLITAVFSRVAIVELDLPSAQSSAPSTPTFRVEVVVRDAGLEIMDGAQVIAAIPLLVTHSVLTAKTGEIVDSLEMASVKALNVITTMAKRQVAV